MTRSFRNEVEVPHPVGQVWQALTDPTLMGLWIMNFDQTPGEMKTDFRPVAGTAYRMEAPPRGWRGYVVGKVLEVAPGQRLVYTWAHSPYQDANPVRVEFTLEPTAEGTRVRMVQSGFPGAKGWFVRLGARLGWRKMLGSGLPAVLDGAANKTPEFEAWPIEVPVPALDQASGTEGEGRRNRMP
ncbi:MAG TPA: SRPBCC domain-containing protein [Candidatus Thermoplasmatota archaeon]|nr:SRPBCC domain-containing protein [Candidatus Thermoplasmatota archaeon]